ncbi:MAG: TIGR03960 family B12-binding radical SAM protein [Christensenellales bacterium]
MTDIKKFKRILADVSKPARYTGGELGEIIKRPQDVSVRLALCFPDIYEVGMSHLGTSILYHAVNSINGISAERCFAPWPDMEQALRENETALFSLETKTALRDFDIVGFSIGYEMCYTNVLCMLELGGIPPLSRDRGDDMPLVIAGGGCAYNPEPLAAFIDLFVIGEGEEALPELIALYQNCANRNDFFAKAALLNGVYIPSLYSVLYNNDGTVKHILPDKNAPRKVLKRIVKNFDKSFFPSKPIVPYINVVHDRVTLELMRGCTRGCRFCQAGFVYRPLRERNTKTLIEQALECIKNTGHEEISLCSLSTGDYSQIGNLTAALSDTFTEKGVSLAVPSLRVDSFKGGYAKRLKDVRSFGLTFAPEAGTQRLRDVINKNITEESILSSAAEAFEAGISSIKLYFMIGLPGETLDDVLGIAKMAEKIRGIFYGIPKERRGAGFKLTLSASCFVPKPHTPFQWEAQDNVDTLKYKQQALKEALRPVKGVKYNWHDAQLSMLEAVFARGDRRLGDVLYNAYRAGCRFDSWKEHFDYIKWQKAFDDCGIDPAFYSARSRSFEETLPWDITDTGVSKKFLWEEKKRADTQAATPDCREGCTGCGLMEAGLCK